MNLKFFDKVFVSKANATFIVLIIIHDFNVRVNTKSVKALCKYRA